MLEGNSIEAGYYNDSEYVRDQLLIIWKILIKLLNVETFAGSVDLLAETDPHFIENAKRSDPITQKFYVASEGKGLPGITIPEKSDIDRFLKRHP